MSECAIQVEDVCRSYGAVDAVRGVSFEIEQGRVVGFIGANGAGKTTTMRMITTLESPTRGRIRVWGHDTAWEPARVREVVGWMPDHFGTYERVTVREYIDFFARAHGLRERQRTRRVEETLAFTELAPLAGRDTRELSTGMKQRLSLARALIHEPRILVLDEPAAGLDPAARVGFKDMVRRLAADGRTLLISSHILSELAEMCDELILIDEGRVVHQGPADALGGPEDPRPLIAVDVLGPTRALLDWIELQPGVTCVEARRTGALLRLERNDPEAIATLLRRMVEAGFEVVCFTRQQPTLERAFIAMLEKVRS